MKSRAFIALFIVSLFIQQAVFAQGISFSHINTSNGLSHNNVQCFALDKNGFLWIGTANGLNVYDGYTVSTWYKSAEPGLPSDTINHLFYDSHNRMWIIAPYGVTWVDGGKNFHPVSLPGTGSHFTCYTIIESASYGVILFTPQGHFYFDEPHKQWLKIDWLSGLVTDHRYNTARSIQSDRCVYVFEESVVVVDFHDKKLVTKKDIPGAVTACGFNDRNIAVATRKGIITILETANGNEVKVYDLQTALDEQQTGINVSEMYKAANGSLVMATGQAGLVMIDSITGAISQYRHKPLDRSSIATNLLYRVLAGPHGEVITGSDQHGVSICNVNNKRADYTGLFVDSKGEVFDGQPNDMAEDREHILWISAADRLIRWNRFTGKSDFFRYKLQDENKQSRILQLRTILIDRNERIWVGTFHAGIALFHKKTGTFQEIATDKSLGAATRSQYINELTEDENGLIWAGTYGGLYSLDPLTHKVTVFEDHPVLKELNGKVVISIFFDKQNRMWVGTQRFGVYCYDKKTSKISQYTKDQGLQSNSGYSITEDSYGNIYVAATTGFSVIETAGTVRAYSHDNGLRYNRCESILPDQNGNVWIANTICLVKYSPTNKKLEYFEENAGISTDGFRYGSACKASDGIFFWGTNRGINYFDPLQMKNYAAPLRVTVYQAVLPDSLMQFENSPSFRLKYAENHIQFHFTAINLSGSRNISYRYMLEGYDKDWQTDNESRQARYASLPPGNYTFKVKASMDRLNWIPASNDVKVSIAQPFWKTWWFISALAILITGVIAAVFRFRVNRIRYHERLRTIYNKKLSETEMKALRAQMNPHFIFNCLNSINKYVLRNDHVTASKYLTRFAKLIRLILDNSNSREVPLSNELEALELYIDMEALRFANKFTYEIKVDEDVRPDSVSVPPLIIQPFVENAIWHGLLHKTSGAHLMVSISKTRDGMLRCEVEDNGIGRAKALELNSKSATTRKSLGMKLTEDRLAMLNQYAEFNSSIEITDLKSETGEAAGTRVTLIIPI